MSAHCGPPTPPLLAAWADHSRAAVRPAARFAAKSAMRAALAAAPAAEAPRRTGAFGSILVAIRRHPMRLASLNVAAAAAAAVAIGWNAGPGSPLHTVQLAREDASLVLAAGSHAADLRLGYAESRLRDVAAGQDRADNLAEAASLLSAAQPDLPASHSDGVWLRWSHDEDLLRALLPTPGGGIPSNDGTGSGGNSATEGGGGRPVGAQPSGGQGGDDGARHGPAPSPAAGDSGPEGDRSGAGGLPTPAPTPGPTPAGDGGGPRGGGSGGGGSGGRDSSHGSGGSGGAGPTATPSPGSTGADGPGGVADGAPPQ